jgi:CRISPR-associated endonuclease/helicase Cas3
MFYSHPGVPLLEHLSSVGSLCKRYVQEVGVKDGKIVETAEIIGKCHDLAKYTSYFQKHLLNRNVSRELSAHSKLSALVTAWLIKQRIGDAKLAGIGFLCVSSHHGSLKSLSEVDRFNWKDPVLQKQAESIVKNADVISGELKLLGIGDVLDELRALNDFLQECRVTLERACRQLRWESDEIEQWNNYYSTLMLFSALVDADKKDAAKVFGSPRLGQLPLDMVIAYRNKAFSKAAPSKINTLREQIFSDVNNELVKLGGKLPDVFTITAPTGSGKTLLGLHVALKLRERLPGKPRIIYSLPYINIIEQAHSVWEDVLSAYYGRKPDIDTLLKHHHLAISLFSVENTEEDLDKQLLLAESWESEIVVTTFEQLLGSIIGCKNSMLKKFHNITGSILLLDEVQAIPLEYWRLVRDALLNLTRFNVKIVLMTATMPSMFHGMELVPNYARYFRQLNRVELIPKLEKPVTAEGLADLFLSQWRGGQSALLVLNTIKSSKRVYEAIKNRLEAACLGSGKLNKDLVLAYLSTSIIPKERKRRIDQINSLLKAGRSVILVSTQVVEAGVDLDFNIAFRDIGPLDSIVQVAGRCNRGWRDSSGQVYVVKIIDDDGKPDSQRIYGHILPEITYRLISNEKCINECAFLDVVRKYYNEISYRLNTEKHPQSLKLLEDLEALDFKALESFSLIEERPKVPVYIEWDEEAASLLRQFRDMLKKLQMCQKMDEIFNQKAKLRKLKAEMENYIVEVYSSKEILKSLKQAFEGFNLLLVPRNEIEAYYSAETGFREGNGGFIVL